jgi:hypothetical protein
MIETMESAVLGALDEQERALRQFQEAGEIDDLPAKEQLAEVEETRRAMEDGIMAYGFACLCTPLQLDHLDSEAISIRAVELIDEDTSVPIPPSRPFWDAVLDGRAA